MLMRATPNWQLICLVPRTRNAGACEATQVEAVYRKLNARKQTAEPSVLDSAGFGCAGAILRLDNMPTVPTYAILA